MFMLFGIDFSVGVVGIDMRITLVMIEINFFSGKTEKKFNCVGFVFFKEGLNKFYWGLY
jgi:hypothetical protein